MAFSNPPLQCYDPTLYEYNTDANDGQCIARKSDGTRCNLDISTEELTEANLCRANARRMQVGKDRDMELERHVLARCCGDHHREKLAGSTSLCLASVAWKYGVIIENPGFWRNASGRKRRTKDASQMQTNYRGEYRYRYMLPPRSTAKKGTVATPRALPVEAPTNTVPFLPYSRRPYDNIITVIQQDAQAEYRARDKQGGGVVFVLQWPRYPGYVKVGYTTFSAEKRAAALATCHQGIEVAFEGEWFVWPKRIERLVHLQLYQRRRKMLQCQVCESEHREWFETSVEQTMELIKEWKRLNSREPLYDQHGTFAKAWHDRIATFSDDLTVGALHAMLDQRSATLLRALTDTTQLPVRSVECAEPDQSLRSSPGMVASKGSESDRADSVIGPSGSPGQFEPVFADRTVSRTANVMQTSTCTAEFEESAQAIDAAIVTTESLCTPTKVTRSTTSQVAGTLGTGVGESKAAGLIPLDHPSLGKDNTDDGSDMWTFFGDFMALLSGLSEPIPSGRVGPIEHRHQAMVAV